MALFKYLNDDAFLIFSRGHRRLYEQALLRIYDRYFSTGAHFPTRSEVVHTIYDVLGSQPELIGDDFDDEPLPSIVSGRRRRIKFSEGPGDTGDKALKRAQRVYLRLIETGWLEEEEYGIKITVDMPRGSMLVMERFWSLRKDISRRFGGVVVQIKTSLEFVDKLQASASEKDSSDAAQALDIAIENASDFSKTLRAILSDLKSIRKELSEATNLRERFAIQLDQFIGKILLEDFAQILTKNHPYRHRDRILSLAHEIYVDEHKLNGLARGYVAAQMSSDTQSAVVTARSKLRSIEDTFSNVGEMFERISEFRRGLEARLRNTIKYAEQGERGLA